MVRRRGESSPCAAGVMVLTAETRSRGMSLLVLTWYASSSNWPTTTTSSTVRLRYRIKKSILHPFRAILFDSHPTEQSEIRQHFTRAQDHAGERVLGDGNRQPGLFPNALVKILQQRAASC